VSTALKTALILEGEQEIGEWPAGQLETRTNAVCMFREGDSVPRPFRMLVAELRNGTRSRCGGPRDPQAEPSEQFFFQRLVAQIDAGYQRERQSIQPPKIQPSGKAKLAAQISKARVMVVDDRADIRGLLSDYLESEGYTVEAVGDGTTALLRLGEFRPQVILLDILMPGLSGISALQRIRAMHPNIAVIMVTGIGDEETAKRSLALGAFDFVTKPIAFAYLTWALETSLVMPSLRLETDRSAEG